MPRYVRFLTACAGVITAALIASACSPTATTTIQAVTALPTSGALTSTPTLSGMQPTATLLPPTVEPPITEDAAATDIMRAPTSTPLDNALAAGEAQAIAAATDTVLRPTPRSFMAFNAYPVTLNFDEFYDGYSMRGGLRLSDKLVSLDGEQVTIEGYMAPPLKIGLDYFVLTRIRLAFCPFCSTAADWPDDIALVYVVNETTNFTELPIRLTGRIEIGQSVDQETGMVSLVRIYADVLDILS